MNKIDSVIAEVATAIEKLSTVQDHLRELKENVESIEKARDNLRSKKSKKGNVG